jgi:hypothetical protein
MKRILLCVVLLASMPGITEAYYGCGVHYSPYALSYHHSGLVSGGVDYSPYAFSYSSSGLVSNYGTCSGSYGDYGYAFFGGPLRPVTHAASRVLSPGRHWTQDTSRPTQPPACRRDGMDIIRQHLRTKGFASVSVDRILRVDNELVSVNVLVKDRNLLIKYWNPEELGRLSTKEAYKQKAYAKYKQDWEQFAEQYKHAGGEIYTVNASESQTIVAALESCTKLGPGNDTTGQPTLYAKD